MLIPENQHDLIEKVRTGDTWAFQQLFEWYKGPVFNFVARMLGNPQDAEDVLQEVFLKIYRKLPTLREDHAFSAWLFSAAKNEALNHLRKHKQLDSLDRLAEDNMDQSVIHPQPHDNPELVTARTEMQVIVQRALAEIPEAHRAAFVLGVLEGYSYKEVATMLDCSVNNVKLRVFRARAAISEKLRPYFR